VILVDTSVWIELLNSRRGATFSEDDLLNVAICGPIAQEVFQGLRESRSSGAFRSAFLALPMLCDPLQSATFLRAAEIYHLGRSKGFTIRSSIDCLVAAIAIENDTPVWHKDRDYDTIASYTSLRTHVEPKRRSEP
jgi:predicted nucleic acid-binding protein